MYQDLARVALSFLARSTLQGAEVGNFTQAQSFLAAIAQGALVVSAPPAEQPAAAPVPPDPTAP